MEHGNACFAWDTSHMRGDTMTQGYKVTFTAGIGLDSNGEPILGVDKRVKFAKVEAATTFGGFSIVSLDGGWISGQDGRYIAEPSVRFEVIIGEDKLPFVESFAVYLRLAFEQSSILVTREPIDYEFIEEGKRSATQ